MDRICRLCLVVAPNLRLKIAEYTEIMSCLRLEISCVEDFPSQVCENCHIKIQDIHTFYKKVIENESKLLEHLKENSLHSFYSNLTNSTAVKDEKNNLVKEEYESQDFDTTYFEPNKVELSITENEENTILKNKKKARTKQKSTKKTRSPRINRDVIRNDKGGHDPNKCVTCFKAFESIKKLSNHYKLDHSIVPGSIKPENDVDLSDKYNLHELEGKKPFYKCNSCGDSNEDVKEIVKHVILHMYERPFLCKLCGKTYKTVYEIVRHGKVHSGFKLLCKYGCGYSSPYPGAMRDHEKRHTDECNYTCKICGKGFLVKTWYDQHQNIHKNVKPFVCDFCGMAFHMHRYLVTHRNKRHPGLSAIIKYTCTQCSFTCDNKTGLTMHMEEHSDKMNESKLTLLCDLCGKGFMRTDHLRNHKNGTHYGIKPYSCSVCNKQFQKKYNLNVHQRTHTGEDKHLCLYCGKFFAQKSTLHRHQKKRHPNEFDRIKASTPT